MGRMQREKGKRFERTIADVFRKRWPEAIVRRASQAERADNPDVFVEGGPAVLAELWLELQDARAPDPRSKLYQAEADVLSWQARRGQPVDRVRSRRVVIVWHKLAERTTWVTMRLCTLLELLEPNHLRLGQPAELVTMDLDAFLKHIDRHIQIGAAA